MAPLQGTPIRRKLMRVIMLTSLTALIITCAAFIAYEYFSFRENARDQLTTLGEITAANCTASLGFENQEDADETLHALAAEKHLVSARLYDIKGHLFSQYPTPQELSDTAITVPKAPVYQFAQKYLEGFQPVVQGSKQLGVLYLQLEMEALYKRLRQYVCIALLVITLSGLLAYLLSQRLQRAVSEPILALAQTARSISIQHDYSVRATKIDNDEVGLLTDAFNQMLTQIEAQNAEIISFSQNLEEKVKERTQELELAGKEIEAVNAKLLKSNHDLEQFAYVASHDLQEPLRKIQTFSSLVGRSLNHEETARKHLDKVNTSAARMSELIRSVLNYSRISKVDEQFVPVDLNQIVQEIRTDFELVIAEKNAVIVADSLPTVKGIPLQLNQLFYNLIGNALKFSDKQPMIHISCRVISAADITTTADLKEAEQYAEIAVKDNGIGFEQQYADQIFTVFQRLHSQQTYSGTGIGLALCKKIVENHHGLIRAESAPGAGATFFIYVPMPGNSEA